MRSATVVPRLGLQAPQAQRDLLLLAVDAQDVDVDFLSDLQNLARMRYLTPGQLRQVHQPVGATQIDEGAEVAEAADSAVSDLAFLQLVDQLLLALPAALLDGLPLGEDRGGFVGG